MPPNQRSDFGLRSGGIAKTARAPGCKREINALFGIVASVCPAVTTGFSFAANHARSRSSGHANYRGRLLPPRWPELTG